MSNMQVILFVSLISHCTALTNTSLIKAYSEVFGVRDIIENPDTMGHALAQLSKLGVGDLSDVCKLDEATVATLVMHAALGSLTLNLKDPSDWSVVVADLNTGMLVRKRSFTSTRYAIMESLLLVAVVALGRAVLVK